MCKCKYQIEKEYTGWWGIVFLAYCIKHNQFLAGTTCQNCPDYKERKSRYPITPCIYCNPSDEDIDIALRFHSGEGEEM